MVSTPDLGIPELAQQQANPDVTHNEALQIIQALLKGVVDRAVNTPPGSPTDGDAYIIGAAPTGAWAGRANAIAVRVGTVWRFIPGNDDAGSAIAIGARHEGLTLWVNDENVRYTWSGSAWVQASIAASQVTNTPAGNIAATDVQAALNELDSEKVAKAGDTMTGALQLPNGAAATPSLRIGSNQTGLFTSTGSNVNLTQNGTFMWGFSATEMLGQNSAGAMGLRYAAQGALASIQMQTMWDNAFGSPRILIQHYRNTIASPNAVIQNDLLGDVAYCGGNATGSFARSEGAIDRATVIETTPSSSAFGTRKELHLIAVGGASPLEFWRQEYNTGLSMYGANVVIDQNRIHRHRSYTVGTLPSAATAGQTIYVSDESGGAVLAFSDGTNWRRVTDRAIVS